MVLFSMIFGRTELIRSVSKAKFDEEADGEVHLSLNPLKPNQKHEKLSQNNAKTIQNGLSAMYYLSNLF